MQEHEYRARDKTVKKMSRDGLKEENLHSRKSIRVSNRETDDFFCATQAEDMEDFSKRGERAEDTKSAKMVFIGRRLPKKAIMQGLETCLA